MYETTISLLAILALLFMWKKISNAVKKEMNWKEWKRDIRTMSTNYVDSRANITESNNRLEELLDLYKNEMDPQKKAHLHELAIKQYTTAEILWAEHEMNHNGTYDAIKNKYFND